jgi:hypothetical protein
MPYLAVLYTLPGGACRTTGLSRGSYPGVRHSITRGPMEVLYRHHLSSGARVYILSRDTRQAYPLRTPLYEVPVPLP